MVAPFVRVEDLAAVAGTGRLRVVDLGTDPGGALPAQAFRSGHLPGSVHVDLDTWLAGTPGPATGRHPLPDPERFAEGMRRAGVDEHDVVVALDRVGGVFAARLVWMLRALGHDAAVLDGGLAAWTAAGGVPETGDVTPEPGDFRARPWPAELLADVDTVRAVSADLAAGRPGPVVLDAREGHRYAGGAHPLDTVPGHIPGARSLPCREHLADDGRLLPADALRARFAAVGVDGSSDVEVVSSCGSGVTACHNLLVMEHLGLGRGRLFVGSWSQWTALGLPVAT